jgi:MFS family permease
VARLGLTIRDRRTFFRLLLPGLLIPIGAGQVIPYLNLFIKHKFGLDLASLNGVFALTSIGTMLAVLYQPTLARRFGRVRSVVLVQGVSIPFLVVLGFSPLLWTVIAAMTVRNSLMNAGNPIANSFAMDRVSPPERATLAAAMSLMWSIGWVVAGLYYSAVQATLGFDAGYTVNFATIIVLYSVATWLYWWWFRDSEPGGEPGAAADVEPGPRTAAGALTD